AGPAHPPGAQRSPPLLLRPAVRGAAAPTPGRLPARRGLPRLPVRLRNHLRAGQPVPRPAVRGASRRSRTRALSPRAMTSWSVFEAAATAAVARLGAAHLRALAASIAAGLPDEVTAHAVPVPGFAEAARAVLRAQRQAG